MNLVFMGSPEFAVPCLDTVIEAGHHVALVVTQPDRPAGRGRQLAPTAIKASAEARGLPVVTQDRGAAERARVTRLVTEAAPDVIVVVAFGHILRASLLELPRHGCLNVHFSLLPRWRGVSPVQHAILHGDQWTGVSVMRMDAGVDTGPVLKVTPTPIGARQTGGHLLERLGELGAALLRETLDLVAAGDVVATVQGEQGATYAPRLTKAMSPVRWDRDAFTVHNQIRALWPVPGTTSYLNDRLLKIGRAEPAGLHTGTTVPGQVVAVDERGIVVACGEGQIRLLELQAPGKRMLPAGEFRRGFVIAPGQFFTS